MTRVFLALGTIMLVISACVATSTPTTQPSPPATTASKLPNQPSCGNQVCEGWENPWVCPEDCARIINTATPTRVVTPTPLKITVGAPMDAPIRRLLGVNIGPAPSGNDPKNANLSKQYAQLNVNLVRTHDFYGPLDMAVMYPDRTRDPADPKSYDFTQSDAMWRAIISAGCEPYFRLGDSWNNAKPPANSQERANWVKAAVEVVRHYRATDWGVRYASQLRYIEIWNEPDNQQFWSKPRTPQEYFQLYAETARELKQTFPDLIIGAPGLTPAGALAPQGNKWTRDFLDYMKQQNAPLDFLSWHMYSNDPNDWVTAAKFYRGELDARGFTRTAQHVTEWNTDVKNKSVTVADALALRTGGKGAAILTAAWIAMQQNGVEVATFYRGPDPAMDAPTFYGLFYANGTPKSSALAFLLWSKLADHPQRMNITTTPTTSLWMLAGKNSAGEIALLIANPSAAKIEYTLAGIANRETRIFQVADTNNPGQTFPNQPLNEQIPTLTPTGNIIALGAETIQLVLINP